MGVVPLPPPKWMNREELREHKYYLERQAASLPFGSGGPVAFPSPTFVVLVLALAPWLLSVIAKVLIGDWRIL